jgi:hypothetical protein
MNDSGPFALGIAPKKIVASTGPGRAGHRSVVSQKRINAGGRQARLAQPFLKPGVGYLGWGDVFAVAGQSKATK